MLAALPDGAGAGSPGQAAQAGTLASSPRIAPGAAGPTRGRSCCRAPCGTLFAPRVSARSCTFRGRGNDPAPRSSTASSIQHPGSGGRQGRGRASAGPPVPASAQPGVTRRGSSQFAPLPEVEISPDPGWRGSRTRRWPGSCSRRHDQHRPPPSFAPGSWSRSLPRICFGGLVGGLTIRSGEGARPMSPRCGTSPRLHGLVDRLHGLALHIVSLNGSASPASQQLAGHQCPPRGRPRLQAEGARPACFDEY